MSPSVPSGPTRRPAPSAAPPPPDDPDRDRRLRLVSWFLVALAMVALVARSLLVAKGAPGWATAPVSFWTFVIAAIAVQGWRGRSRIRRSVTYLVGMAVALVLSLVASAVPVVADSTEGAGVGLALTLTSVALAVAALLWAGPARPAQTSDATVAGGAGRGRR